MLKIIRSIEQMDFSSLKCVYAQSCQERGQQNYPDRGSGEQLLWAEQDLYAEVNLFLRDKGAFYAVWEQGERYVSALRMEPYKDGLLLEGLESTPASRRKGHATALIRAVISELDNGIIYSHVDKRNYASLAVHRTCGFKLIRDYAVFADGSVSHHAYTLQYHKEEKEPN